MKTCVIYSGQARTFKQCFPNHLWHLFSQIGPNFDVYSSVAIDNDSEEMRELLKEKFGARSIFESVHQPTLVEPKPAPQFVAMYPPSSPPQAILRQFWALERAWGMVRKPYERYIRIRPDLLFSNLDLPELPGCYTPWWGRWGGVNDRFAVLSAISADVYFTTFERIDTLMAMGAPLHPETLLKRSLRSGEIKTRSLSALFCTLRKDGRLIQPSITVEDYAEYARGES